MENSTEKMNKLAHLNPYNSVVKVISEVQQSEKRYLIGIKDVKQIPSSLIEKLTNTGNYMLHTLDAHALGGRAIDLNLFNPISGKYMTGSSSGSAINVRVNINDIGIATDGGGSVLAPAMAVQCFGFICPLIEEERMSQYSKVSTDGISFSPSIGFIARSFDLIVETYEVLLGKLKKYDTIKVEISEDDNTSYKFDCIKISNLKQFAPREEAIKELTEILLETDVFISIEGPIDREGFGDSLYGHFDDGTKLEQSKANKGYIRVANMVNATCIVVPSKEFAKGYAVMCESKKEKIEKAFQIANKLVVEQDKMIDRYFSNLDMYFEEGYGGKI